MSLTRVPEHRAMLPLLLLFFIFYDVGAQPPLSQPSLPFPPPPSQPESVNINPMVALLIAFSVSSLFFAIFITIYIIDCTSPQSSPRSNLPVPKGGVDPKVIGGFPTFVYSEVKEHKIGKGALECAVCLCEFEDFERLRLIQKCDHVFHQECIDEWLSGHVTCPVCRTNLAPPSGDSVKDRTDGSGPEEQYHVEIGIDEATVASVEVMPGMNGEGGSEQSNWDLGRESHSGKLPHRLGRSHSTGHSLVRPKDYTERFTLRLPDEVRKQIMERPTTPYFPGEGRGSRLRFSKSERWVFSKTPFFLPWVSSVAPSKSPKFTNDQFRADRVEKSAADRDRPYKSGESVCEPDA